MRELEERAMKEREQMFDEGVLEEIGRNTKEVSEGNNKSTCNLFDNEAAAQRWKDAGLTEEIIYT